MAQGLARNAMDGPVLRLQLARVYALAGEAEKGVAVVESLLKVESLLAVR